MPASSAATATPSQKPLKPPIAAPLRTDGSVATLGTASWARSSAVPCSCCIPLAHRRTAIHVDGFARHLGGLLGGKVEDGVGGVLGGLVAAERHPGALLIQPVPVVPFEGMH